MRTALDSSVVILLQRRQPDWEWWRQVLTQAATEGSLLINPVVFAECSAGFQMKLAPDRQRNSDLTFAGERCFHGDTIMRRSKECK